MDTEKIYRTLKEIVRPHHNYTDQMMAISKWIESEFEPKKKGQELPIHNVVKSLPDGDDIWCKASEMSRDNFADWYDNL